MPTQKLPFNTIPYQRNDYPDQYTIDNEWNDELINGYLAPGTSGLELRKRFGKSLFKDLGTNFGVDGMYYWKRIGALFSASGGHIYKTTDTSGTTVDITGDDLLTGYRVSFAESPASSTDALIYAVNGNDILYSNGTDSFQKIGNNAPGATHVQFLDTYLLANRIGTQRFAYSNVGVPLTWSAVDFAGANAAADLLVALWVKNRQIYLFKENTMEIWYNDGSSPFSRRTDTFIQTGCYAKYSVADCNGVFIWLNDNRDVVALTSPIPEVISAPIKYILNAYDGIADALGDYIVIDRVSFYVLTLPTANRTFAFNLTTKHWCELADFNINSSSYRRFSMNCYTWCENWNMHLIGDPYTGKIYKISSQYDDDADDYIKMVRRTHSKDDGTQLRKRCNKLTFSFKRGKGKTQEISQLDTNAIPHFMLRWKDDDENWSSVKQINAGRLSEFKRQAILNRCGIYRNRVYELSVTDKVPFILYDAEENVEPLNS